MYFVVCSYFMTKRKIVWQIGVIPLIPLCNDLSKRKWNSVYFFLSYLTYTRYPYFRFTFYVSIFYCFRRTILPFESVRHPYAARYAMSDDRFKQHCTVFVLVTAFQFLIPGHWTSGGKVICAPFFRAAYNKCQTPPIYWPSVSEEVLPFLISFLLIFTNALTPPPCMISLLLFQCAPDINSCLVWSTLVDLYCLLFIIVCFILPNPVRIF